ncbi:TolC family protein [Pedobacter sp. MR2016-24]|uniref:TolC family protein n=1 Tax=Pedobacter sp. MR2016-24 TaxID=2994466 RepID=UPI0022454D40|nr:TolC family protein [Pedobacter sp. MR2016-24]MCX2484227.1 TolC family protein [Pedobacter sp. MR2016-24]
MKTRVLQYLIAIAILFAFVPTVNAQESMIPEVNYPYLEKLIASARENYPRVKTQQQKITGAKADVTSAAVSFLDAFSFNYFYRPKPNSVNIGGDLNNIFNGPQYGVTVNLGTFLQKPFAIKKAKSNYNVTKLEAQEYDLTLVNQVKTRYFTYIQQLTLLRVLNKITLDTEGLNRLMKSKFEKGEESLLAYNQTLTQVSSQYQQKIAAEAALLTAKSALEELVGQKLEDIK